MTEMTLRIVVIGQAVIDRLAVAAGLHHAVVAQTRELLRHGRLPQRQDVLQFGHRPFALSQKAQQEQAVFVRDRFEEIAGLAGLAHQLVEFGGIFRTVAQFVFEFGWDDRSHGSVRVPRMFEEDQERLALGWELLSLAAYFPSRLQKDSSFM